MNRVQAHEPKAKQRVNLTADPDLVAEAKAMGLNLSKLLETELRRAVREERKRQWVEENKEALEAQRIRVEQHGTFGMRVLEAIKDGSI